MTTPDPTGPRPSLRPNLAMAIPVAGWIYLVVGALVPLPHALLRAFWWIDLFLSVVVHALQIPMAHRVALPLGFSRCRTAGYTMLLGATWWKPLARKNAS